MNTTLSIDHSLDSCGYCCAVEVHEQTDPLPGSPECAPQLCFVHIRKSFHCLQFKPYFVIDQDVKAVLPDHLLTIDHVETYLSLDFVAAC